MRNVFIYSLGLCLWLWDLSREIFISIVQDATVSDTEHSLCADPNDRTEAQKEQLNRLVVGLKQIKAHQAKLKEDMITARKEVRISPENAGKLTAFHKLSFGSSKEGIIIN